MDGGLVGCWFGRVPPPFKGGKCTSIGILCMLRYALHSCGIAPERARLACGDLLQENGGFFGWNSEQSRLPSWTAAVLPCLPHRAKLTRQVASAVQWWRAAGAC